MTPNGWYTVFSASLDSLGGQDCTPFSAEIPKSAQNRGTPPFFFLTHFREPCRILGYPLVEFAGRGPFFPPLDHPRGKNRTFSPDLV